MEWTSVCLILLSALLWGATDALVKLFAPPQLRAERKGGWGVGGVLEDFLALVRCPGYLACQVGFPIIEQKITSFLFLFLVWKFWLPKCEK